MSHPMPGEALGEELGEMEEEPETAEIEDMPEAEVPVVSARPMRKLQPVSPKGASTLPAQTRKQRKELMVRLKAVKEAEASGMSELTYEMTQDPAVEKKQVLETSRYLCFELPKHALIPCSVTNMKRISKRYAVLKEDPTVIVCNRVFNEELERETGEAGHKQAAQSTSKTTQKRLQGTQERADAAGPPLQQGVRVLPPWAAQAQPRLGWGADAGWGSPAVVWAAPQQLQLGWGPEQSWVEDVAAPALAGPAAGGGGKGAGKGAKGGLERRRDPGDGQLYTKGEFLDCYGNLSAWYKAAPEAEDAPAPSPQAAPFKVVARTIGSPVVSVGAVPARPAGGWLAAGGAAGGWGAAGALAAAGGAAVGWATAGGAWSGAGAGGGGAWGAAQALRNPSRFQPYAGGAV
eukprot:TRINITY_DN13355_c0_g1_i1.p1 TRINITY_DN13355_c0_g1~~TRINITY_DN13355_c0_g1_i1.p1  ORF type:complete len:432 (+),score=137.09 TRINITY_DN13355_c0_g1_i1:85-1296(+)